jgi:hypothetical protein
MMHVLDERPPQYIEQHLSKMKNATDNKIQPTADSGG